MLHLFNYVKIVLLFCLPKAPDWSNKKLNNSEGGGIGGTSEQGG